MKKLLLLTFCCLFLLSSAGFVLADWVGSVPGCNDSDGFNPLTRGTTGAGFAEACRGELSAGESFPPDCAGYDLLEYSNDAPTASYSNSAVSATRIRARQSGELCYTTCIKCSSGCLNGACSPVAPEENCGDDRDNDSDGNIDCADTDCQGKLCDDGNKCTIGEICKSDKICGGGSQKACGVNRICNPQTGQCDDATQPIEDKESNCYDGIDNDDSDNLIDCSDSIDCPCPADKPKCNETTHQCEPQTGVITSPPATQTQTCQDKCKPLSCGKYNDCELAPGSCVTGFCCSGACTEKKGVSVGPIKIQLPSSIGSIEELITRLMNWAFWLALIIAPLIIVWAAFLMMTSRGDPKQTTKARKLIIWALIGLAIMGSARLIVGIFKAIFQF